MQAHKVFNVAPNKLLGLQNDKKKNRAPKPFQNNEGEKWFTKIPALGFESATKTSDVTKITSLYAEAMNLYTQQAKTQQTFEDEIIKKGTTSDKVAALVMLIAKKPLSNAHRLDKLLEICESKNSRAADLAISATGDLFSAHLLPRDRVLRLFKDQPLESFHKTHVKDDVKKLSKDAQLVLTHWYFEEQLKKRYRKYLDILKTISASSINAKKLLFIKLARQLVKSSPEEVDNLLRLLINKFGDPEKEVSTKVMSSLLSLVNPFESENHTNPFYTTNVDRTFLSNEISNFLYDSKVLSQTKVYAATLLNQIELVEKVDKEFAEHLMKIYLKVAAILFKHYKETDTAYMRAVLTGVHRAYKVSGLPASFFADHIDSFFKVARMSIFNTAIAAMRVIWALVESSDDVKITGRFYTMIYDKMLDNAIRDHSSKCSQFLTLVYHAIHRDNVTTRQRAFIKRLVQISHNSSPAFQCAALLLIKNVIDASPELRTLLTQAEDASQDDDEQFTDADRKPAAKPQNDKQKNTNAYDPFAVRPQEAGAEFSCLWELIPMISSFHPSAQTFAKNLLDTKHVKPYQGNPLEDFSLVPFLDKFMNKKPKKTKITFDPISGRFKASRAKSNLLSSEFVQTPKNLIKDDEQFFYKYVKQRQDAQQKHKEHREQVKQDRKSAKVQKIELMERVKNDLVIPDENRRDDDDDENADDMGSDVSSVYSYSELDQVLRDEDTMADEQMDELLMRYASDDENEMTAAKGGNDDDDDNDTGKRKRGKKNQKRRDFGYDVTKGDLEETSRPQQDDIADLLEKDEKKHKKAAKKFALEDAEETFGGAADGEDKPSQQPKQPQAQNNDKKRKRPSKGGFKPNKKQRR